MRIRAWMWAGRLMRWYAEYHSRISHDAFDLAARCFNRAHRVADEVEARLH
jgi:hypothetical protein